MAVATGIAYKDMTPAQKKKAEKWSKWFGIPVEEIPMTKKTGMIIINREDCPHLSDVDYALVREGFDYDEITDELREDYLESLKRDKLSDEDKKHAAAGLAARRGR